MEELLLAIVRSDSACHAAWPRVDRLVVNAWINDTQQAGGSLPTLEPVRIFLRSRTPNQPMCISVGYHRWETGECNDGGRKPVGVW